jgi:hypothetical protein
MGFHSKKRKELKKAQAAMLPEYQSNCNKSSKAGNKGVTFKKLFDATLQTNSLKIQGKDSLPPPEKNHSLDMAKKFKKNEIADIVVRWGVFSTAKEAMKRNKGPGAVADNDEDDATLVDILVQLWTEDVADGQSKRVPLDHVDRDVVRYRASNV